MKWKDLLLIPNLLTLGRIILVFPALHFLHENDALLSILLLTFVFLTDFFDGFLARKLKQSSQLGAILDPVADKVVVLVLFSFYYFIGSVPIWYFILILTRDLAQLSAIPILLFWKKISFQVKPKLIPKWGTALNFIILAIIIFQSIFSSHSYLEIQENLLFGLMIVSGVLEIYILTTFLPRFYLIYNGNHDTFE